MNTQEEKNRKKAIEVIESVKAHYSVRGFKTTTEGVKFMKKIAPIVAQMSELKTDDLSLAGSRMFEMFDEDFIKYVVSTFVYKKGKQGQSNQKIDYEKEFVNDFDTCIKVFMYAVTSLMEQAQGKKKAPKQKGQKIHSNKRSQNSSD